MATLYNTFLYNTTQYNGALSSTSRPSDDIYFEYFGLQNSNVITSSVQEDIMPSRVLTSVNNPDGDGKLIQNDRNTYKRITIEGTLRADTASDLDDVIFELKKNLNVQNGLLKVKTMGGTDRYYVANCINGSNIISREGWQVTFCKFTLTFDCFTPYARDLNQQVETYTGTNDLNITEINEGNADTAPLFILSFTSASSVTQVNFKNVTTDEEIQYDGTINTSDILVFNALEKTVELNGSAVDFSGFFWNLKSGVNNITLDVDGTFDILLTVKYYFNYL